MRVIQLDLRTDRYLDRWLNWVIVQERSHPAVPNIKECTEVVSHIRMVVVVMRHVVKPFEHPMARHPSRDHFVAGVAGYIDHRIVRKICKQNDRLKRQKDHNQHQARELQNCF